MITKITLLSLGLMVLATLLTPVNGSTEAIIITDDCGQKIVLSKPARRIVTLYGALTETVCSLGFCDRLVGVTKRDKWPPQVRTKTKIGTHMRPNLELILSLEPDLVLQGSIRPGSQLVVEKLKSLGIPVAIFNPTSFEGLYSEMKRISILCGRPENGIKMEKKIRKELASLAVKYPLSKTPKVIFEISYPNFLVAGQKNFVTDIILKSGAVNPIIAEKKFLKVSLEKIISLDPDVYIVQKGPMNRLVKAPEKRPNFSAIPCVKKGRIKIVDEFVFSRPTPRSIQAVKTLRSYLFTLYPADNSGKK